MFNENYLIKGIIHCETGLHIGNSSDNIDIGGSDKPIIRDSITNLPFIPGSSLKGKLRVLLELNDKLSSESVRGRHGKASNDINCVATQIFGIASYRSTNEEKLLLKYPTRTIVRDSYPTAETIELWKNSEDVFEGAELKYENFVDRINARSFIRNIERIPRGSEFNFEIIFSVYKKDKEKDFIEDNVKDFNEDNEKNFIELLRSMKLLEDNYLGGSGTRGFGKIRFKKINVIKRDAEYYKENIINPKNTLNFESISDAYIYFKKGLEGK